MNKESIFTRHGELKRRPVDISRLTGVSGDQGVVIELTLGGRELLENIVMKKKGNIAWWSAAYIALCLHVEKKYIVKEGDSEVEMTEESLLFDEPEKDIPRLAKLPNFLLSRIYTEALKVCGHIRENEILIDDDTLDQWLLKRGITRSMYDAMDDDVKKTLLEECVSSHDLEKN